MHGIEAVDQSRGHARAGDVAVVGDRDPGDADQPADQQAEPGGAGRGDDVEQRRGLEGAAEELLEQIDARDLDHPADQRADPEDHRDRHRPAPLGDLVLGAGKADVGVLELAGRRVARIGVMKMALLKLAPPRRARR